jgi:hypothetical protein
VTSLDSELETYRRQIATDAYPMSIGELANLYRDGELNIHPEFQRLFRWSPAQRTRLIESVLLGIPLPSIFVAASDEGWDVVDGVQRLSTIFAFMGILKNEDGEIETPFVCDSAPFLTFLRNVSYEPRSGGPSLTGTQRIDFKRSRIDVKIIKRESDKRAKYDLFQRLNSFGSQATDQELRNALLVSISKKHFEWLMALAADANFLASLDLPARLLQEQYHVEIALRFVTLRQMSEQDIRTMGYIGEFVDSQIVPLTDWDDGILAREADVFRRTFELLADAADGDVLRKWSVERQRAEGPFSATAFEVLALGIGYHDAGEWITVERVQQKRNVLWGEPRFAPGFSQGIRADSRMRTTIPYGRELFAD